MKLTPIEKLQLLMLCDIYKQSNIQGNFNPQLIEDAIRSGNSWVIEENYASLINQPDIDDNKVALVFQILAMYRTIKSSYDKLSEADKQRLSEKLKPFGREKDLQFCGFDTNLEADYFSIANMLKKSKRFIEITGLDSDSHTLMLPTYQKMLTVYTPLFNTRHMAEKLSVDDLIRIFSIRYESH